MVEKKIKQKHDLMKNSVKPSKLSKNYSGSSAFFTPNWMISSILNGIEFFLVTYFNKKHGLGDPSLVFFEPSSGEMAFPISLMDHLRNTKNTSSQTKTNEFIHSLISNRLYCYEIDPDIYREGKQKFKKNISQNYNLNLNDSDLRHIFLQNTVSSSGNSTAIKNRSEIPKKTDELLIILGNPPYSVSNTTNLPWIKSLIEDYKTHLNRPGKKKIVGLKGIQDDYVKFLRFAQWKLDDQDHPGILAFVVNNYFIDGDIFRGMRHSLHSAFDYIYIINLHGDPKKKRKKSINSNKNSQEGDTGVDENPFNIQTGICLFFGVRLEKIAKKEISSCRVYYLEKKGSIHQKEEFLLQDFAKFPFLPVPKRIDYEFIPISSALFEKEKLYNDFPYLPDIFKYNIIGVQSLHDTLVTHPDKARLIEILSRFYSGAYTDQQIIDSKNQVWVKHDGVSYHDARDWKIADGLDGSFEKATKNIIPWQWRGFDRWWVSYDENLMTKGSSSYSLMQYFLSPNENLAIGVSKVSRKADGTASVFITDRIAESHFVEGGSGIGDYIFPLKIGSNRKKKNNWRQPDGVCKYNFSESIFRTLSTLYPDEKLNPEDIFYYICAILNCPKYSAQYQFFLKKDFPHIPFPKKFEDFILYSQIGRKIADSFILNCKSPEIKQFSVSDSTDRRIFSPFYDPTRNKIFFRTSSKSKNKIEMDAGFWVGNISAEMWKFEIGGIPQLSLWLKNRKYIDNLSQAVNSKKYGFNRSINNEELAYFLEICCAIKEIIKLKQKLDELYQKIL